MLKESGTYTRYIYKHTSSSQIKHTRQAENGVTEPLETPSLEVRTTSPLVGHRPWLEGVLACVRGVWGMLGTHLPQVKGQ